VCIKFHRSPVDDKDRQDDISASHANDHESKNNHPFHSIDQDLEQRPVDIKDK